MRPSPTSNSTKALVLLLIVAALFALLSLGGCSHRITVAQLAGDKGILSELDRRDLYVRDTVYDPDTTITPKDSFTTGIPIALLNPGRDTTVTFTDSLHPRVLIRYIIKEGKPYVQAVCLPDTFIKQVPRYILTPQPHKTRREELRNLLYIALILWVPTAILLYITYRRRRQA
jgi:hypothetical protein